jgi:CHAD domain-containing protein
MAELCRRVWGEQLTTMLVNEAGVRFSDDIEYVHDMRVATRRARAAGKLYADYFDPKSRKVERFMRNLRTTGRLLGSVRDLDVALHKLAEYADEEGATDKSTRALQEKWTRQRASAHTKLVKWLDSKKYRRFVTAFLHFCGSPGTAVARFAPEPGEPPTPHQVRHVLPSLILGRYEAIRAFEVLFENARATSDEVPIETLHALRIECKYMRYHLEFNAALLGPESAGLIRALKGLQEHLGELNDASVSSALVAHSISDNPSDSAADDGAADDSAADDGAAGDERDGIADYAALQASTQEALRHSLPADLDAFLAPETRRTLALAIARI